MRIRPAFLLLLTACGASPKYTGLILTPAEERKEIPKSEASTEGLPPSFDLSAEMPPPGDQGRQHSCVGWAVGYALRSYWKHLRDGRPFEHAPGATNSMEVLSPAFLYNQLNGGEDTGARLPDAIRLAAEKGVAPWLYFPYREQDYLAQPGARSYETALRFRLTGWGSVDAQDVDQVKAHVYCGYPVLIGADVDDGFMHLASGEICSESSGEFRGWQAMVVVGYDDERAAFKVMNSWGRRWGSDGFGWIDYEHFRSVVREAYIATDGAGGKSGKLTRGGGSPSRIPVKGGGTPSANKGTQGGSDPSKKDAPNNSDPVAKKDDPVKKEKPGGEDPPKTDDPVKKDKPGGTDPPKKDDPTKYNPEDPNKKKEPPPKKEEPDPKKKALEDAPKNATRVFDYLPPRYSKVPPNVTVEIDFTDDRHDVLYEELKRFGKWVVSEGTVKIGAGLKGKAYVLLRFWYEDGKRVERRMELRNVETPPDLTPNRSEEFVLDGTAFEGTWQIWTSQASIDCPKDRYFTVQPVLVVDGAEVFDGFYWGSKVEW